MRHQRANILISAIFIAVFLFFLSVALVTANRQNIHLTLLADHKLRARHAAEQGVSYALQRMKTDPQWETDLLNKSYSNTAYEGVSWNVMVVPKVDFGASNSTNTTVDANSSWNPANDATPHFYEIKGRGVSGVYQSEYKLVVEEFRLCDSVATLGKKPFLFMMQNATLCMMDPSFTWSKLAQLDTSFLTNTLTGNGGDVFMASNNNNKPTQILDWNPTVGAGGFFEPGPLQPSTTKLPWSWNVQKLVLQGNQLSWKLLDDPSTSMGKTWPPTPPTLDGVSVFETPPPKPKYQQVFIPGVGPIQVDISEYKGPTVEYYQVDGDLHADEKGLYCHATHWFYLCSLFQNKIDNFQNVGTMRRGKWYHDDCVLRCDGDNGAWKVVTDRLQVTDKLSAPEISPGPRPNKTYLHSNSGKVYSLGNSTGGGPGAQAAAGFTILECGPKVFTDTNKTMSQPSFFSYQNKLRTLDQTLVEGISTINYTNLALTPLYPSSLPGKIGMKYDKTKGQAPWSNVTLADERTLRWVPGMALNGMVVVEKDLLLTGTVTVNNVVSGSAANSNPPPPVVKNFLCHYDGSRWQLWPSGLYPLLEKGAGGLTVSQGHFTATLDPAPMALGGFDSQVKLLRRYQPILTEYP